MHWSLGVVMAGLLVVGCGSSPDGDVVVFAAASLTDAFTEIGARFEEATGMEVEMSFAGSSALREQILEGAPAGVFASANTENMVPIVDGGFTQTAPVVFAVNAMAIAVPAGNPASVTGVDAFGAERLLVGLCAPGVPCGTAARTVLANAGVTPLPDTNEPNVRSLVTKLEVGEIDVGMVYRTDVQNSEEIEEVALDVDVNVAVVFPVAVLAGGGSRAEAFVEFLQGEAAREVLARHGFVLP